MSRPSWPTAIAIALLPGALFAGQVTDLITFTNGQTADADQVNANFSAIADAVNANLLLMDGVQRPCATGGFQTFDGVAAEWSFCPARFEATGADQTWVVPDGITEIDVTVWGAGGGAGRVSNVLGGAGGFASGTIPVTPGETLYIVVGEGGEHVTDGLSGAGKGGGLSGVFRGTPSQATALVVAGGGGGGGYYVEATYGSSGGNGGGTTALDGAVAGSSYYDSRGRGATTSAGGAGGCYVGGYCGTDGAAMQGGDGGIYPGHVVYAGPYGGGGGVGRGGYNSGGGGGGYWGGGGGANNAPLGGGGGTGYLAASVIEGTQSMGDVRGVPPETSHAEYPEGVGYGGHVLASQNGGDGFVVISR
jgi:hypothetical protein